MKMKKLFFALLLMMCTCVATQAATYSVNDDPVKKIDLTEMIEKAKAEGANWNEDQWKDAFREVLSSLVPMLKDMTALSKKVEGLDGDDTEAMTALMTEATALEEKYKGVEEQIEEFGKIADSFEIGKRLGQDDAFQQELFDELGITELMKNVE